MAALSKKFFVKIAAEYEEARPPAGTPAHAMWSVMVARTADVLAAEAERFDRARFLAACGMEQAEAA
jgi:hypothetical protein